MSQPQQILPKESIPSSQDTSQDNDSSKQLKEENEQLIHKITQLNQIKFKQKEKIKYLEETNSLLVDDLENKSKLLQQQYIFSKTSGRSNQKMQVKSDKPPSVEVMKKMEQLLEDTLLKNIQLQVFFYNSQHYFFNHKNLERYQYSW